MVLFHCFGATSTGVDRICWAKVVSLQSKLAAAMSLLLGWLAGRVLESFQFDLSRTCSLQFSFSFHQRVQMFRMKSDALTSGLSYGSKPPMPMSRA